MVEILRYFIFIYCFLGIFIAGGLFFNKRSPANITLSLFIIFFTLEQLDFLFTTSEIVFVYPQYYLIIYPICLLFGPALWLHFSYIKNPKLVFKYVHLLHAVPFVIFVVILLSPILKYEGLERIEYTRSNFMNHIMPLNYIRTTHVALYGLVMLVVIFKERLYKNNKQGMYLSLIAAIYFVTAVLQSYLTLFADSYRQFSIYFFLASSIVLIVGIVLYAYPELLQQIQLKYFGSNLKEADRKRIVDSIKKIQNHSSIFLDSDLSLASFCGIIQERQHHVSQVFSEDLNTSFNNYVNEKRVEQAKLILGNPAKDELKILAVAFECGFNNHVTFHKAFQKFTGIPPGKFRKDR